MNSISLSRPISAEFIARENAPRAAALNADYEALAVQLHRRGTDIERITSAVQGFRVAIPSWASAPAGHASHDSQGLVSHATSSRSSKTAQ